MQLGWSINYPCTGVSICAPRGAATIITNFLPPNAFIKLVIVKKLKIESLTQTRLIFGRTQLAEANLSATELGPIAKVLFLGQDFLFASNLYLVLD